MLTETQEIHEKIKTAVDDILAYKPGNASQDVLKEPYDVLGTHAPLHGLDILDIEKLIGFIIDPSCRIPLAARTCIVRDFLFPRSKVSNKVVMLILGRFTTTTYTPILLFQQLLKWLVIVYEFLEDSLIVSKLYASLLTKISYETTRQWVCHLLYLATTQALAKPWRAKFLIEEYSKYPNSIYLVGLLKHYKEYNPALVSGFLPIIKPTVFQHPNESMATSIREIYARSSTLPAASQMNSTKFKKEPISRKRPHSIMSSNATIISALLPDNQPNLGVETITSIPQFIQRFHKLEFPLQMSYIVNDTGMLSRLLLYKNDSSAWSRFNSWLLQSLVSTRPAFNISLLEKIVSFVTYSKELPASVESYLCDELKTWDGKQSRHLILHLLSYLPIQSAEEISETLLGPLKRIVETEADLATYIAINEFLLKLLKNWKSWVLAKDETVAEVSIKEQCRSIRIVSAFVDHYGLVALEMFPNNIELSFSVLDFFEELTRFPKHEKFPIVITMSNELCYYLILSGSAANLSRVCGIVTLTRPLHLNAGRDLVFDQSTMFQSVVLDICNGVWLNKAFDLTKSPSSFSGIQRFTVEPELVENLREAAADRGLNINTLLSLSSSTLFCRRAAVYMRQLEKKQGVVQLLREPPWYISLKQNAAKGGIPLGFSDFRVSFLDELDREGFHGLHDLLYSSMKRLMELQKKK